MHILSSSIAKELFLLKCKKAKKAYRRKYYSVNKGEALKQSSNYYALNSEVKKEEMKNAYALNLLPKKLAAQKGYASNPLPKKLAAKNKYASNPLPKKLAAKNKYASNPLPKKLAMKKWYVRNLHQKNLAHKKRYRKHCHIIQKKYYQSIVHRRAARLLHHALHRVRENLKNKVYRMQNKQKLLPERRARYALTEPKLDTKKLYVKLLSTNGAECLRI